MLQYNSWDLSIFLMLLWLYWFSVCLFFCQYLFYFCTHLNFFNTLWLNAPIFLNTFVDSFQGCYKDGTQPGSRDYRVFSVVPLIFRWLIFIVYALILNASCFPLLAMIALFASIIFILLDPFQKHFYNMSYYLVIFTIIAAICCVSASGTDIIQIKGQFMPLFYFFSAMYGIVSLIPLLGIVLYISRFSCWYINKLIPWMYIGWMKCW